MNDMKNEEMQTVGEEKKPSKNFSAFAKKTGEISKKAVGGIQKGMQAFSEKVKADSYKRRQKKYNPIFWEEFKDEAFDIPNVIKIVDNAVRKDIDVCKGSIGWLEKVNNTEILFLYDNIASKTGIDFFPLAECDQVYYVDCFERHTFVNVQSVFARAHNARLAELGRIAFALGAKSYLVEIEETKGNIAETHSSRKTNVQVDAVVVDEREKEHIKSDTTAEKQIDSMYQARENQSGTLRTYFSGSRTPTRPELKWFATDDVVKNLIDMRCSSEGNLMTSQVLNLEGFISVKMSRQVASTIDMLLQSDVKERGNSSTSNKNSNISSSMLSKVIRESESKLIFDIEF